MNPLIRIATRKSPLALWQAEYVRAQLLDHHPNLAVELVPISTRGDDTIDTSLRKIGGKGLFVKELEAALLDYHADVAVHSLKDMPMILPQGLVLGAICKRADPSDALVSNSFRSLNEMPAGSIIGSSSLRRKCQILAYHPSLVVKDLRGNVNTRLTKLDNGDYDALILASAGLERLKMNHRISDRISSKIVLPAAGQGAVAIESRADDPSTESFLRALHHHDTFRCVTAERSLVRILDGGCHSPVAAFAEHDAITHTIHLRALVGSSDGKKLLSDQLSGPMEKPERIGEELAESMLSAGAKGILADYEESC
ncbi:MAG: hydroxymethylbilane synthase [Cellvibrionales bacterium TMED148]|nr:hydroxymethylbilane synthase [Porticoccaceae bacterium]RPG90835.1 MAG: hydroxymethylbilane synthase [Cellvibrionales bacterium TMED148]